MSFLGLVLYGPPASGKDTVTKALSELDNQFTLFERLRVSTTPKPGYRNVTEADADALVAQGQIVYENSRYGNRYLVDRAELTRLASSGKIPVLHIGQIDGIRALQTIGAWLAVELTCRRETAAKRAESRGDSDVPARLAAWDQTQADLAENPDFKFGMVLRTDHQGPHLTANVIRLGFTALAHLSTNSGENPPG